MGGAWWGTSACWEPLVLMGAGYLIWTWSCDAPGFTSISCSLGSTLIWGEHNSWRVAGWGGGEEAFLSGGELLSVAAAAAIGVLSGRGGTEGVAVTTGTIGMTAIGSWRVGRDGGGGTGRWCGCWRWLSSPQVTWLAPTGWDGEATSSTCFDSASLLMSSLSSSCSSSKGGKEVS